MADPNYFRPSVAPKRPESGAARSASTLHGGWAQHRPDQRPERPLPCRLATKWPLRAWIWTTQGRCLWRREVSNSRGTWRSRGCLTMACTLVSTERTTPEPSTRLHNRACLAKGCLCQPFAQHCNLLKICPLLLNPLDRCSGFTHRPPTLHLFGQDLAELGPTATNFVAKVDPVRAKIWPNSVPNMRTSIKLSPGEKSRVSSEHLPTT